MADNKDDQTDKAHYDPNWIGMNGGRLHSNNVLFYFMESPFFDQVSGNQSLFSQWINTPNQNDVLGTKAKFEANLRLQRGVQYVVEHDPLEKKIFVNGANGPEVSRIWVIRKQNRESEDDDSVTVLAYYFIVNDIIYQAPSVAGVLNNRLLNAASALGTLFETPADVSFFSVSHGHTYQKPIQPSTRQALTGAAPHSREGSVVPESQVVSGEKPSTSGQVQDDDDGVRTLREALRLTVQYGKEYSDDMTLEGEPGNFRFSKNKTAAAATAQVRVPGQMSTSPTGTPAASSSRAASVVAHTSKPAMSKGGRNNDKATLEGVSAKTKQSRKSKGSSP